MGVGARPRRLGRRRRVERLERAIRHEGRARLVLPPPQPLHVRRLACRVRRERGRALHALPRRNAHCGGSAPRSRRALVLPDLPHRGSDPGRAPARGRRVAARPPRAARPALLPRRLHPQGGGRLRRATHHRQGEVGDRPAREHEDDRPRHLPHLRRRLAVPGVRHGLPERAAAGKRLAEGGGRAQADQDEPVWRTREGLDALPVGPSRPDVRPQDARPRRERTVRPDAGVHGPREFRARPLVGPRRLLLRLPRAGDGGRQGRGGDVGLDRIPARQGRQEGQPRRVGGEVLQPDPHGHLPP